MSASDLWQRYRDGLIDDRELGFRLDTSRMDLPEDLHDRLRGRINHAFTAMKELEGGAIANPDEKRMVGHYWLRAPGLAPTPEIRDQIEQTLVDLERFVADVHDGKVKPTTTDRFRNVLVVGIGGSALGPQLVADALGTHRDAMQPHFLDNTDPNGIDRVLDGLGDDLASTLVVVISKSGGTPETRNGMLETKARFDAAGLPFGKHAVAITGEGSKLDAFATEQGFIARFPMWDWVGGRTSQTATVGLIPAALQGLDVRGLLDGAAAMDARTRDADAATNPAMRLALAWHHATGGKGERDMVILPYRDRLMLLSRYLQQLVMESLGKEKDLGGDVVHQGIAVYGNKGSTDQHAYVQQLREGVPNFFATFIEVLHDRDDAGLEVEPGVTSGDFLQGFFLGTRRALYENGRASLTITVDQLDARSLGMLIALYERAVGFYASLVGINAYHQPGVEAGKKAAAAVLDLQGRLLAALRERGTDGATVVQLAEAMGADDDVETLFHLLERLSRNPSRGIGRRDGSTPFEAFYTAS